ncbi:Uncharacterised protein [uncultured Clostridium sp.]|nr:Uncharacterised protein [uncultured Clostridium sp.]
MVSFDFNDAVFTYMVGKRAHPLFKCNTAFDRWVISHTPRTQVIVAESDKGAVAVIGLCVDAHGEMRRTEIPHYLLKEGVQGIQVLLKATKRLAGSYVILFFGEAGCFAVGDATCSVPVYYSIQPAEYCLSSCDELLRRALNLPLSPRAIDVRKNGSNTQPYPYDMSICDEVKALLPHHFLDLTRMQAIRSKQLPVQKEEMQLSEVIHETIEWTNHIVAEYAKYYQLICPLTGGWDSRLILSFLKRNLEGIECFTFKHPGFNDTTDDYYLPQVICANENIKHTIVPDEKAPQSYTSALEEVVGVYQSHGTIDLAYTYRKRFPQYAIINGNIIDQVGKSLIGNSLHKMFANTSFFTCKLHNYSKYTKIETQKQLREMKQTAPGEDYFDLFAIESRCGRWAAQTNMLYSLVGIDNLNIFNCEHVIALWRAIPRKLRRDKIIHQRIFAELSPELLKIPFNTSHKFSWMSQNAALFFLATYVKAGSGYLHSKISR